MSTPALSGSALVAAQQQFEAALPAIATTLRFQFKDLPRHQREEALADARAATWSWWTRLLAQGKDPLAIGVTGIASNAAKYVRGGRKIGNQTFGRGCPDIQDPRVRRKTGLRVVSIEDAAGPAGGAWRDWLAESNRVTQADEAAIRVDFGHWLTDMPVRKRMMAELLAEGKGTGIVAKVVGVSEGRVSQVRLELGSSWKTFQGEASRQDVVPVPRGWWVGHARRIRVRHAGRARGPPSPSWNRSPGHSARRRSGDVKPVSE